jgi:uncharacterized protein (DUF305 family)
MRMITYTVVWLLLYTAFVSVSCSGDKKPPAQGQEHARPTPDPPAADTAPFYLAAVTDRMLDSLRSETFTGAADADFVGVMLRHQRAALDMYRYIQAQGVNPALSGIARGIAARLQEDVSFLEQMQPVLKRTGASDLGAQSVALLDSLTRLGFSMHGAYPDLDFATMMIQHHQNALALARLYQRYGTEERLLKFTAAMRTAHANDVQLLTRWKEEHYPQTH